MYLEEDSSKFTHKGYTYSVNDIIVATKDAEVEALPLTCFYWMIPLVKVNEDRLRRADVSVPVIYTIDEDFGFVVLDGAHRLIKTHLSGQTTIRCKKVSIDFLQRIRGDHN